MTEPTEPTEPTKRRRRWYDDPSSSEFAAHVAKDPWRLHVIQKLDDLAKDLFIRWALVCVGLVAVGIWTLIAYEHAVSTAHTVARFQDSNTKALCTLRHDLRTRVQSGNQFLALHPNGIPGIPLATLRNSINGEQQTLAALALLHCPADE